MFLQRCFCDPPLRVVLDEESPYGHFFGGPPIHEGARFEGAPIALHLLHCFNLNDPLLPIEPSIHNEWLPLYYGVPFDGCEFGYHIGSEGQLRIFSGEQVLTDDGAEEPEFADYPLEYPKVPFRLEPLTYEQERAIIYRDAWLPRGGRLSHDDRELAEALYPYTQIGGILPFLQGPPRRMCPNPACPCHHYGFMSPLTVVLNEPIPGLFLWGEYGDWTQIIFVRCDECGSIYTYNECD
jgi:hypothetical protein